MRLDGHERGCKGELQTNMNEQRRRRCTGSAAADRVKQREAPEHGTANRGEGEPQPTPKPRQRLGGPRHYGEI